MKNPNVKSETELGMNSNIKRNLSIPNCDCNAITEPSLDNQATPTWEHFESDLIIKCDRVSRTLLLTMSTVNHNNSTSKTPPNASYLCALRIQT